MTEIEFQTTGNVTNDPELRFTPSGRAVANFTIAVTPRTRDAAGKWSDGETTFLRGAAWQDLGQNVAETVKRGDRVSVTGIIRSRTYQTKEGENRTVMEAIFRTVAVDLQFATAKVTKVDRLKGGLPSATRATQDPYADVPPADAPADEDPWASADTSVGDREYHAAMQSVRNQLGGRPQ